MSRCAAFTLVELVVSMTIASVLLLGMGSAMIIASQAMPDAEGATQNTIIAAEAAEQIAAELQYAVAINDSNATSVEFTVADRDEDDLPETIRYQWSGTPGDSLTRQYNGGALTEILTEVQEFSLSLDLQTTTTEIPQSNESAETTLASYDSQYYLDSRNVQENRWRAQYFAPSLPADTLSWKVTRVFFYAAAKNAATGEIKVQLQLATAGGIPSGVVLQERTLLESTLSAFSWNLQEFSFSEASGLSPDQKLCLVLKWVSGAEACQIRIREYSVPSPHDGYMRSIDQGLTWQEYDEQSFLFWVYGTVTTESEPEIETLYYLDGVDVNVQKGTDAQSAVNTRVRLVNQPEVMQ